MANDLNLCQFIGRAGQDPELRYTQNNVAIANLSLAVSKSWKDANGEKKEITEWVRIVAYKKLAEVFSQYVKKGSKLYVSGSMQTRKWQGQDGVERYTTEVVVNDLQMLDSRNNNQGGQAQQPAQGANAQQPNLQAQKQDPFVPDDDFDDALPF